jgi:lysophospholipase L1-like esterase
VPDADERETSARVARGLLVLCGLLAAATLALGVVALRQARREVRLADLSEDQRRSLLEQAERIAPAVYQPYPLSRGTGFYHMKPDTRYDREHPAAGPAGVLGDEFTTNELGFRSNPLTARRAGIRRMVVVGDSWTFGPAVPLEAVFSQRLEALLNRDGTHWEVFNLAMPGWNTANELSALHVFLDKLDPDVVVICPTSNDIDDSFEVWKGRLVQRGFQSGGLFRHSYEYERRWLEIFQSLQRESAELRDRGIEVFVYFLAEWRELAAYYADLAGLTTPYGVVPTELILPPHLHEREVDAGRHANAEGHERIAAHLYDSLLAAGTVPDGEPVPSEYEVRLPGRRWAPELVDDEFAMWRRYAHDYDLIPLDGDTIREQATFSLPAVRGATSAIVELRLIDALGLYPLRVEVEVSSPEATRATAVLEAYAASPAPLELSLPASLEDYDFVEVSLRADRAVSAPGGWGPASMERPLIRFR